MKYDDIIDLPHPVSEKYPRMTMSQRAAQFNPFAALTGYDEEVEEAGRYTEEEHELTDESVRTVNEALTELKLRMKERPNATVCFFEPDARKNGGAYHCITGTVRKIDEFQKKLHIGDQIIYMDRILSIETVEGDVEPRY